MIRGIPAVRSRCTFGRKDERNGVPILPALPAGILPAPMPDNLAMLRQQAMQPAPAQPQSGVLWVSGEAEARNYLIAPNSAVALWDSTGSRVYLKKADASGKPTLQVFDLVERTETPQEAQQAPGVSYVTRTEFDALAAAVRELRGKKEKPKKVEEDGEDE